MRIQNSKLKIKNGNRALLRGLLCLAIAAGLSGCLPRNFGMKSLPRQNVPVDDHPYVPEQKEYEQ